MQPVYVSDQNDDTMTMSDFTHSDVSINDGF